MLLFSTFVSLAHDEHGDECDNFLLFCYTQTMDILPVTMYPMEKGSLGWLNVCCQRTIFNPWCEMTSLFKKDTVGYHKKGLRKNFKWMKGRPKIKSQIPATWKFKPLRREVVPPQHWNPLKPAIQLPKIMVLSYVFSSDPATGEFMTNDNSFPRRVSSQLFQGLNFVNDLQPAGWTKAICFVEAWMCMEDPVDEVVPPGVPMRWICGDFC